MSKSFYITTPIYYPNDKLHLGHAYSTVLADIFARYHALKGDDAFLVTGSDEHSSKIVRKANELEVGIKPYLNKIVSNFKILFKKLNVNYSCFIRTSDRKKHWPGAIDLWIKLKKADDIYKSTYSGLYCVGCETFLKEKDLVGGVCPLHNEPPQNVTEENYFFRLSRYKNQLKEIIKTDQLQIIPNKRKKEILVFLNDEVEDVSFSRPKSVNNWSIPIPGDDSQGMYVWCDALTSYLSAIGYPRDKKLFKNYWPTACHLIGKDILRFHAVIWPAMLLSAKIPLPKIILVHGMLLSGGRKMSKTLGNVVDPELLIKKFGVDAVRYFFAAHIPITTDGEINETLVAERYNSDLVNGLGNLISRVLGMAILYKTPIHTGPDFQLVLKQNSWYSKSLDEFDLHKVTNKILEKIQTLDKKIAKEEPFKVIKTNKTQAHRLISDYLQEIWTLSQLLKPIMPNTSQSIQDAFKYKKKPILFRRIS